MRTIVTILVTFIVSTIGFSQNTILSSNPLTEHEINSIFTDSLKTKLEINYSVYRAYEYNDKGGKHFIVMTENKVKCDERKDCFDAIKVFCFLYKNGQYDLEWNLTDFILPKGNEVSEEYSISIWTKYFELNDHDNDGFIDPIIVYGTFAMNGTSDGRIKILVYHKGKKSAIRHQNGTLDFERNTQVDESYYQLPKVIQDNVQLIMKNITEDENGIFPYNWKNDMENQKLNFDEN
ncbi:hypothetical protein DFQ09_103137 [Winogradskyella pacifica]|uniref:Uncharacterized protein n=1 Tax=Winogradskyella pacifica TaxID=664642 RepID=A0A3D9N441_9FLAO|nr:hypothetical protein [Winogradskyella pacifica]REE24831.1 hypothetical protein DFQ09_103137 [Winogradskyella pacifica]